MIISCSSFPLHDSFSFFKDLQASLARTPGSDSPIAFSYTLFRNGDGVYVEPANTIAWYRQDTITHARELGKYTPSLAAAHATTILNLFDFEDARYQAESWLMRILDQSKGEEYHFAATYHGMLLLAKDYKAVTYDHGETSIACAFLPKVRSGHAIYEQRKNIAIMANALLEEQAPAKDQALPTIAF